MNSIAIRKRLDELIATSGEDYASLSRRLGRNPTYIQQFIKRGVPRRLSEDDRRLLAEHLGIAERLLGGPDAGSIVTRPDLVRSKGDYVLIPRLAVGASAGVGCETGPETPLAALAFQSNWVREVASGRPEALSVIGVEGDSMLPTLADGDQILVDTDDRDRLRDGIYVLRTDDALLVK
ncbi:MAG: S24 family peptidase, partial [Polymorphobacter sp.]